MMCAFSTCTQQHVHKISIGYDWNTALQFSNLGSVLSSAINSQHDLASHLTLTPEISSVKKQHQQFSTLQSFGKGKINACDMFQVQDEEYRR